MIYRAYIGKRRVARTSSFWRAYRALIEQAESVTNVGEARIEREDGCVVARIDLDISLPPSRPGS